jgi:SP family myo-inositol transporter-like MFS transporter 13
MTPLDTRRSNFNKEDTDNTITMGMTSAGEISELAVLAEGEERTTWFIWMLVSCCCISGLLFGK